MILYEYYCGYCGHFSAWNSMTKSGDPVACPTCDELAKRVMSVPYLADMDANNRIAHQRNEKSAHEPRVVTREKASPQAGHSSHSHGHHGHHGQHRHLHRPHGPSRPWMIGH